MSSMTYASLEFVCSVVTDNLAASSISYQHAQRPVVNRWFAGGPSRILNRARSIAGCCPNQKHHRPSVGDTFLRGSDFRTRKLRASDGDQRASQHPDEEKVRDHQETQPIDNPAKGRAPGIPLGPKRVDTVDDSLTHDKNQNRPIQPQDR